MNSITWLLPTLIALFAYGIGQGLVKKNIGDVSPARFCLYFVVAKALVNLGYFLSTEHPAVLSHESRNFMLMGIFSYILDGAAWILYFQSIVKGPITIVGTLSAAYPAITVLLARIFLNEALTENQYIGIAAVIGGCILLSYSPAGSDDKIISKSWIPLAATALLVWGISQTLIKHAYTFENANEGNLALCNTIGGFLTLGIYGWFRGRQGNHSLGEWKRSFFPMALMALGDLGVLIAVKTGPVSIVIPVSGAYPVVTLGFAWFVLKERILPLHWIAIFLVVGGIYLAG